MKNNEKKGVMLLLILIIIITIIGNWAVIQAVNNTKIKPSQPNEEPGKTTSIGKIELTIEEPPQKVQTTGQVILNIE